MLVIWYTNNEYAPTPHATSARPRSASPLSCLVGSALLVNYTMATATLAVGTAGSLGAGQIAFNMGTLMRNGTTTDSQMLTCNWHQTDTSMVTLTGCKGMVRFVSPANFPFTPAGEVGVTVSDRQLEGSRRKVHSAVRDTGIGIPKDRFDRLFKVFSQVDVSTTRRFGGTGLGLAISKRLSELMGGRIWAESEPGKGSTFHFTIVADEVEALERAAADGEQPELAGKRVLIVDDNASNRLLLKLQTERWGMRARDTNSPAVALEWIVQGDPFDVALLDYQMPEMDGIALAREIRAVRRAHAPVLILLSSTGQSLASAHADAGFAAGLSKPLRLSHLRDRLLETIGHQRDTSAGAVPPVVRDVGSPVPLRILLAEDNAINQKVALRLLERLGYGTDVVGDGRQALARLDHAAYDVILMDVQMPEMDGLEASRAICARWAASERPRIIAMTAEAMQGDRDKCLAAGMDDYIVKPVTLDRLAAALAKCRPLAAATAPEAAAAPPVEKQTAAPHSTATCSISFAKISEGRRHCGR